MRAIGFDCRQRFRSNDLTTEDVFNLVVWAIWFAEAPLGELDLVAEFVDSLKQYGCTEANDLQVRDGTRYLMRLFHADGDSWLAHTENRLSAAASNTNSDDHDETMHKVWTAMLSIRPRTPSPIEPHTCAAVVRRWLKARQ